MSRSTLSMIHGRCRTVAITLAFGNSPATSAIRLHQKRLVSNTTFFAWMSL